MVKTLVPCVCDEVIAWHVMHGWVYDVYHDAEALGVFYCTVLCGSGAVCHFTPRTGARITPAIFLAACRKCLAVVAPACYVLYATIPETKVKLIRVAVRLGFGVIEDGGFILDGDKMVLLKYYGPPKR